MTRDDLVKQLEKAERRSAVEKSYDSDISFINAKTTLQLWDMAYAAGFTNRGYLLAALGKLWDESHTIQGASDDYKEGRAMGIQLCINELSRGEK
jgi:hypothetical protein